MSNQRLIECVPNFSEGQNMEIIQQIAASISAVTGVQLLDVDPGKATNRTVVTFVGNPEAVVEAAFQSIKKAAELIDMSKHKGEHPRMGATDVCPLIPISGISMEETVFYAHQLAKKVGEELAIPVYTYEAAATMPERKNLADIRAGEYEALEDKLKKPEWKPDYGKATFNKKAGATVIGARDFLVAYNVNLNTTSVKRANSVAFDIREQGRVMREGDPVNGKIILDASGEPMRIPGTCKSVKAIGWFIEEYGLAQVSMNLTDINVTPLHIAFDECQKSAIARGLRVTGSELVGMVPKKVLTDAGKYFIEKQNLSSGVAEEELIRIAVKTLGLDELAPFDPKQKIIEYKLGEKRRLVGMDLRAFANETASEVPAPGGGSISAYVGTLGASLATMVANLSGNKKGWDSKIPEFSVWANKGQVIKDKLLWLVDEDTNSYKAIMEAFKLPKETAEEKIKRKAAVQVATIYAVEIPLEVMETSFKVYEIAKEMVIKGNPNSITDAAVGALCAKTAIAGAYLNVKINISGFENKDLANQLLAKAEAILAESNMAEQEIWNIVNQNI
ncbi:MAG: glutamate formimidoyltransferase [Saprospiraceae bacterium]|nr:glutamate formimidoyltransferase [Saprospiraceae bacterium]